MWSCQPTARERQTRSQTNRTEANTKFGAPKREPTERELLLSMHFACKFACNLLFLLLFLELWRSVNDTETPGGLGFERGRRGRRGGSGEAKGERSAKAGGAAAVEMRSRKSLAIKNLHKFSKLHTRQKKKHKLISLKKSGVESKVHCTPGWGGVEWRAICTHFNAAAELSGTAVPFLSSSLTLPIPLGWLPPHISLSLALSMAWPNVNELCLRLQANRITSFKRKWELFTFKYTHKHTHTDIHVHSSGALSHSLSLLRGRPPFWGLPLSLIDNVIFFIIPSLFVY